MGQEDLPDLVELHPGRCWHLSVSATRLRRYSFAVSRDARRSIPTPHNPTPAPTRQERGVLQYSLTIRLEELT